MDEEMAGRLSCDEAETGDGTYHDDAAVQSDAARSIQTDHDNESAALMEKPAISDLQAAAGAFNEAFNTALYEIEHSRKEIRERSARLDELNEAVRSIRSALDDEVDRGRRKEEDHLQETTRLRQRVQEVESERDGLRHRCEEAGNRLQGQQSGLEDRDRQIADLGRQIDGLLADLEARNIEASRLNQQVTKLQGEVAAQTESMRLQSESSTTDLVKQNAEISRVTAELETLRVAHAELAEHAEKLKHLNQTLRESFETGKAVHKQQFDEKVAEIELPGPRLEAGNASLQDRPVDPIDMGGLKKSLHELEEGLLETVSRNRELGERAEKASKLEELNVRLRLALKKARELVAQNGNESQEIISLREQVVDLQSALETAGLRDQEVAAKLQGYEALEQEVIELREVAANTAGMQSTGEDDGGTVAALQGKVERLSADLIAAEEKCRQLEAEQALAVAANRTGTVSVPESHISRDPASPDRGRFLSHLGSLLARQECDAEHHTLMYILLDNFILIRDEIGIMESESLVKAVAKMIESACKADDYIARFGDCTFVVLCCNTTAGEVEETANTIRAAVEARIFEYNDRSLVATTSIGICSVRRNDANVEKLISRVDLACEAARLSGGNRVIVSSAIADEITITGNDEDYEEMVLSTLSENRVKIYYQPISCLRGQCGKHFEVLIRLVDESGDMILPGEFFAMAESFRHAHEVDRIVIDKAMKAMSESGDKDVKFYIKLTGQSVADAGLPDWIRARIVEYGVKPTQLVFEVAENILQTDLKNVSRLSRSLNEIGCKTAIEHYRMSTNHQHLMHVHVDYLKIDKGLVGSVKRKGGSLAKVTAIVNLAKQNGFISIAEGVEDPACMALLWDLGVCMAQGYFIQALSVGREYADQNVLTDSEDEIGDKPQFVKNPD